MHNIRHLGQSREKDTADREHIVSVNLGLGHVAKTRFRRWWQRKREKSRLSDWIMVALTLVIASAALWSWSDSRLDFRTDQRSWVGVTGWESPSKLEIGAPLVLKIVFKNTGKTPASNVRFVGVADPRPSGSGPDFNYSGHNEIATDLGFLSPGADFVGRYVATQGNLTEAGYDDITTGRWAVYVHGKGEYDDIFGCHHWITYCFRLEPDTGNLSVCSTHNEMDNGPCRRID
jgi:hypothetical protein